jgi:bis(5'-nucleosyl)-tetraphosphatase (symmetrical)
LAVRGNHDNGALREALTMQSSDSTTVVHAKYQWLYDKDTGESTLDDDDIEWLAQLPYTIRIPAAFFDDSSNDNVDNNDASNVLRHHDTLIVHAGLVPGIPLEEQSIDTMVTLRNLVLDQHDVNAMDATSLTLPSSQSFVSWASQWKGPEHVLFGHDAKRGLQQTDYCIGLDTGAVYGKQLTGILLPERRLVHVDALRTYCPIQD